MPKKVFKMGINFCNKLNNETETRTRIRVSLTLEFVAEHSLIAVEQKIA